MKKKTIRNMGAFRTGLMMPIPVPPEKIKKILVVRNDRFGEFLLNIPVLVALKGYFHYAEITLVIRPEVEALARRIPPIDRLIGWDSLSKHSLLDKINLIQKLKREKFDLGVILNPSKEFNLIAFFSGIRHRVGYDRKWGFLLNCKIKDRKSQGLKHEAEYNLDLIRAIGIDTFSSDIKFPLDIKKEDFPDSRIKELGIANDNLIAFHPWTSNREKEWPQIKYKELIVALARESDAKLIVIGGSDELERSLVLCKDLPVVNLTGKTTLIELATLLKRCKLFISADSGPMHLAAIVGAKVVALFRKGPASVSARRWGPVGIGHIVIEGDPVADIEVSEVLDGVKKILR
jgi:ADP-heptose:LPS heptosyltransferase